MKKILIACEESQRVCIEFRKKGFIAFSCDLLDCSGGHPEWHIKRDVKDILNGHCYFFTVDGCFHYVDVWDMIIAFPPCTYLTNTGNRWFNIEKYGESAIKRHSERKKAQEFFMLFVNANCNKIAIENPVGCMSTYYKQPSQIIHPYMFGDPERKSTCLWLKNLPLLQPTNIVEPNLYEYKNGKKDSYWHMLTMNLRPDERAIQRSKTFPGIAQAFAEQWSF